MMGQGVGSYLSLDEIESSNPIMIFMIISYLFNCTFWIYPLGYLLVLINSTLCYCFGKLDMILKT